MEGGNNNNDVSSQRIYVYREIMIKSIPGRNRKTTRRIYLHRGIYRREIIMFLGYYGRRIFAGAKNFWKDTLFQMFYHSFIPYKLLICRTFRNFLHPTKYSDSHICITRSIILLFGHFLY